MILGRLLVVLTVAGIVVGAFDFSRSHPERHVVYWIATVAVDRVHRAAVGPASISRTTTLPRTTSTGIGTT